MIDLGMSRWQWRLRWQIGGKLVGWGVFRIMPKCVAQEEFAEAVAKWSGKWSDPITARESFERPTRQPKGKE